MKKLILFMVCVGSIAIASAQQTAIWVGVLDIQGNKLTLVVRIKLNAEGKQVATLEVPEQNTPLIPVTTIKQDDKVLEFTVTAVGAAYEGKVAVDGKSAKGTFKQSGQALDLNFDRDDSYKPKLVLRPQTPKKPYPYKEEEVSFDNKMSGNKLVGTLTLPSKGTAFAAAIMITGSGPQDRDETLLGHKPFLVIADYLTRNGIAVLRCDDRGVGKSTGVFATATTADFATDIRAAYAYLKTRKEINAKKIGLIGHSEGGIIGPMVASEEKGIAFVVMLAGTGVNGEQIVLSQAHAIAVANRMKPEDIGLQDRVMKGIIDLIKGTTDPAQVKKKVVDLLNAENNRAPEDKRVSAEIVNRNAEAQIAAFGSPWFRYFLSYDPAPALKKVKCPVLALNGSKDLQVIASLNLPVIEKALKAGGNQKAEVRLLPGLNHLFQVCKTGSPNEYKDISETTSPEVLKLVASWINKTTK